MIKFKAGNKEFQLLADGRVIILVMENLILIKSIKKTFKSRSKKIRLEALKDIYQAGVKSIFDDTFDIFIRSISDKTIIERLYK